MGFAAEGELSTDQPELPSGQLAADIAVADIGLKIEYRENDGNQDTALQRTLCQQLGLSSTTARILQLRGINSIEQAREFLFPTLKDHIPDPSKIKNIEQAADLILDAVEQQQLITVFSDFDVDGLTSGAQLSLFLAALGARVGNYVPNRFVEGYGLSKIAVEKLANSGTELLITVDCGITSVAELFLAKRLGMKSIVFDHHLPGPRLPPADVVVDPAQDGCPFAEHSLAAAGLIWMLLIVLRTKFLARPVAEGRAKQEVPNPKDFLDLAAMGTICDMVPLRGLNRVIAHRGIEALRQTSRVGVEALKEVAGVKDNPRFGSGHIGFGLGPRINAAGRLGDANQVIELLTTRDSKRAKSVAEAIDRLNDQRRTIENKVKTDCIAMLSANTDLLSEPAIAVYGADFHLGVIGIAAQRLVEEYNRPAAVMGPGESNLDGTTVKVIKGSVRSVTGFHVADVLAELGDLLLAHGGHAQAGGFTLSHDRLEQFQQGFIAAASKRLTPELLQRKLKADLKIPLSEIDFDLAVELAKLAPFGVGNPSPVLVSEDVSVAGVTLLRGGHLKARFSQGESHRNAVAWGMQGHPLLRKDLRVNIAYQVELNTYRGVSSVQLMLKEIWQ